MGIYKKGENWYIDYYVQGRRKREKIGVNKKLAVSILAKRKVQVVEGKFLDIKKNEKIKFEDMANLFLESYAKVNKKSWKRDQLSIKNLSVSFKGKYIYEINNLDIEEYKRKRREEGKTGATINRELACLRTIFNKSIEWGKLKTSPPKIKLFKENNQRVRYLEKAEAKKLIEVSPEPLKSIIIIALNTGMRRGEILNLKWRDIDFKEKIITIWDTKNKEKRVTPINKIVYNTLLDINKNLNSEYVFVGKDGKRHISGSYISHLFEKIIKKLGIKNFRFHDLRHTFASWLIMKGIDLKTVQELLGHKTFNMTLRYAHLSPDHKKLAVEILEEKEEKGIQLDTIWTPEEKQEYLKSSEVIKN